MSDPIDDRTSRAAALTSEELLRRTTQEFIDLRDSGAGMWLELHPAAAFAVVAMCQLALRHPDTKTNASAPLVEQFIEYVRAKFEPHAPAIAEAIRRGNLPQHDTPPAGEIPPEAFGGMRPPAPELRFWRLIEERSIGEDGIQDLQLACGHHIAFVQPLQESQEYAYCPQCVHAALERSRQARENIITETAPNTKGRDWARERFEAAAEPPEMEQERALLRRLLNSRDPLENARLTFGHEKHRMIFQRIMDLHGRGAPVDRVALANELMKNGELQAIGGLSYLVTLYEPAQHTPRIDRVIRRGRGLMEFILASETPRTPEEIVAFMDSRRDPAPAVLTCPYCGHSEPAMFEKVAVYICAKCGRTVETE